MAGTMNFIDFLVGKTIFEINIRDPREISVLNLLKKKGFYDCSVSDGKITLSCGCGDASEISSLLGRKKLDFHVRTIGLRAYIKKLASRSGILFAVAVSLLLNSIFSGLIWHIDVIGNETISEREIREKLYSFGVYEGASKRDIDVKKLTIDYMLSDGRVSFMHLNMNGTSAVAEISERGELPERGTDKKDVCNIVAKCDGVITRIDVYSGGREAENGESVEKGQLLISSFFETRTAGYLLRRAKGTVFANTFPVFEMRVPKRAFRKTSSETSEKRRLRMLGMTLPLDGTGIVGSGKRSELEKDIEQLSLFGIVPLPVVIETDRYILTTLSEYERNENEAKGIFGAEYEKWKNEVFKDAHILSEETEMTDIGDSFVFTVRLSCIESIGIDKPFEIREN